MKFEIDLDQQSVLEFVIREDSAGKDLTEVLRDRPDLLSLVLKEVLLHHAGLSVYQGKKIQKYEKLHEKLKELFEKYRYDAKSTTAQQIEQLFQELGQ